MQPTLAKSSLIYFLSQAPNIIDDQKGKPLTGTPGKLLRECLPDDYEEYSSFDNVIRDYPGERQPSWQEIECCRQYVTASIEAAKPKLVVGLGPIALSWALGSTDMAGMRGRLFAVKAGKHSFWFLPTFDPAYVIEKAYDKKKPMRSKYGHCFRMDVNKAFDFIDRLPPAKVDTAAEAKAGIRCYAKADGVDALIAALEQARKAPLKAVDIETNRLRPYAKGAHIVSVALSHGDTNISFPVDHPKAGWSPAERSRIMTELGSILTDDTIKIAHNAPFELEWFIKEFGKTIVNHWAWECTMMQAHFLDERRGKQGKGDEQRRASYQNLDFLCKQHFGISIKKLFKLPKHDMDQAELDECLLYNGVDTKYTLRLFLHQTKLLKELGVFTAYHEALPRQPTVALMQHIGIDTDQVQLKKNQQTLQEEIDGILDEINHLKVVQAYIKDHKAFNPQGPDVLTIFKDYLKCPEVLVVDKNTGEERLSTDKNVLDKITHPLAELLVRYRNRSKLKSTYVDCFEAGVGAFVWPDSKLHTSFNTTFTVTGRTSSDEPNQQNWPKRNDAWVRGAVVPPKGHLLVAFDYGQLEACTSAMCSKDKVLVKALWEDYDIHMEWTHKLVSQYPAWLGPNESLKDKITAKNSRSIVKNKLVFPAIFGATNKSIAGYLKTPEDEIEILMDEFWDTFSDLKNWQDRLMKSYYEKGYVASPTGRRRNYPLTRNEAINFPIQSVASDIVCDSMNILSQEAVKTNNWYLHPVLNIHDDLTFVIPDDDNVLDAAIRRIYTVMLQPPFKFVNVPMSVECSVGYNWYDMKEIGKFWSNKDL